MREPELYRITRTGVRFDPDGVELKNADGRYRRYYGITPEQLAQAMADGLALKRAALTSCHTWDDWGMFLTDVEITEPEVEVNTATIPGRHGVLDYSEALTGAPVYHNRTIALTLLKCGKMAWWHEEYSQLLELLHGKVTKLIFDTDPAYYYEGRCTVSSVRESGVHHSFTITMDAAPFRYACADSTADWLWDPFDLENGVIREASAAVTITNHQSAEITVQGCGHALAPSLVVYSCNRVGAVLTVTYENKSYKYRVPTTFTVIPLDFLLSPGSSTVRLQCIDDTSTTIVAALQFREERL